MAVVQWFGMVYRVPFFLFHFPLQLQEQKTRVEQFLAEAQLRRVSVISRVATELREPSAVFLIDSRIPVELMLPEVRVQRL